MQSGVLYICANKLYQIEEIIFGALCSIESIDQVLDHSTGTCISVDSIIEPAQSLPPAHVVLSMHELSDNTNLSSSSSSLKKCVGMSCSALLDSTIHARHKSQTNIILKVDKDIKAVNSQSKINILSSNNTNPSKSSTQNTLNKETLIPSRQHKITHTNSLSAANATLSIQSTKPLYFQSILSPLSSSFQRNRQRAAANSRSSSRSKDSNSQPEERSQTSKLFSAVSCTLSPIDHYHHQKHTKSFHSSSSPTSHSSNQTASPDDSSQPQDNLILQHCMLSPLHIPGITCRQNLNKHDSSFSKNIDSPTISTRTPPTLFPSPLSAAPSFSYVHTNGQNLSVQTQTATLERRRRIINCISEKFERLWDKAVEEIEEFEVTSPFSSASLLSSSNCSYNDFSGEKPLSSMDLQNGTVQFVNIDNNLEQSNIDRKTYSDNMRSSFNFLKERHSIGSELNNDPDVKVISNKTPMILPSMVDLKHCHNIYVDDENETERNSVNASYSYPSRLENDTGQQLSYNDTFTYQIQEDPIHIMLRLLHQVTAPSVSSTSLSSSLSPLSLQPPPVSVSPPTSPCLVRESFAGDVFSLRSSFASVSEVQTNTSNHTNSEDKASSTQLAKEYLTTLDDAKNVLVLLSSGGEFSTREELLVFNAPSANELRQRLAEIDLEMYQENDNVSNYSAI